MKTLIAALVAASTLAGTVAAQTSGSQTGGSQTGGSQTGGSQTSGSSTPAAPGGEKARASGDGNQAVVTTSAHADAPAKGANSFTRSEAEGRIGKQGFSDVADLKKDSDGVWRGQAKKDGKQVAVWLDYKGNVGQGQ